MKACYQAKVSKFCISSVQNIVQTITKRLLRETGLLPKDTLIDQIFYLKNALDNVYSGHIFLECLFPGSKKRADCIILNDGIIFVINFSIGYSTFNRDQINQVYDHALALRNYHDGSRSATVIPILVATMAETVLSDLAISRDGVAKPICVGRTGLYTLLEHAKSIPRNKSVSSPVWEESSYTPSPTIIEAYQALYHLSDTSKITRLDETAKNLTNTINTITQIIDDSKRESKKSICIVTGTPGSGKTLTGLSIASQYIRRYENPFSLFLSRNTQLIDILREAMIRDHLATTAAKDAKFKKHKAQREASKFVQNLNDFRDHYLETKEPPSEHIVIFDEAQCAWVTDPKSKFIQQKSEISDLYKSELEFLLEVMDRHPDWCTFVCLINGGKGNISGEIGLDNWLTALGKRFKHWDIHGPNFFEHKFTPIEQNAESIHNSRSIIKHEDLHLSCSKRFVRTAAVTSFVKSLLDGDQKLSSRLASDFFYRYPIFVTRELTASKNWLKCMARGSERIGLVASSGALRLKPEGINVKQSIDHKRWFLSDVDDVRSSHYLEDVATQTDIAGLELDWVGVCWDADLRIVDSSWQCNEFRGNCWHLTQNSMRQARVLNAYSVLLTRARHGMVIFVPKGDAGDPTRQPEFYDPIYEYLLSCGISKLPEGKDNRDAIRLPLPALYK